MPLYWNIEEWPAGVVSSFLAKYETAEPKLFAEAYLYLQKLREEGNALRPPYSQTIGDKLFELRPKTDEIALRLIYYFSPTESKVAVFVHAFVKKTQQTPKQDKNLAKRRRAEHEAQLEKERRQRKNQKLGWSRGNNTYH